MRTLSVYNPRLFLLTQAALEPAGLWPIVPGYDTPLTLSHEELDLSLCTGVWLVVAGDRAHPLSRSLSSHGQVERLPGALRLWWQRGENLAPYARQPLSFVLEIEIGGRLLRVAEGQLEVASQSRVLVPRPSSSTLSR